METALLEIPIAVLIKIEKAAKLADQEIEEWLRETIEKKFSFLIDG